MKPDRVSAAEAADMIGVSGPTFAKLITAGAFPRSAPKAGYNLREVVRGTVAHYQRQAAGRGGPDDHRVLSSARARHADAVAEAVELKNGFARGELVSLSLMQRVVERQFIAMREIALSTPGKVADAVSTYCMGDREAIFAIIDKEIRFMLTQLSTPEIVAETMHGKRKDHRDMDADQVERRQPHG
jgi:phage terminase Nu1 subunit (DNA packaging protein)